MKMSFGSEILCLYRVRFSPGANSWRTSCWGCTPDIASTGVPLLQDGHLPATTLHHWKPITMKTMLLLSLHAAGTKAVASWLSLVLQHLGKRPGHIGISQMRCRLEKGHLLGTSYGHRPPLVPSSSSLDLCPSFCVPQVPSW